MQERRKKYENDPKLAWDILEEGSKKASAAAEATMVQARAAMNMSRDFEAAPKGKSAK
jgi:hypothetical protein